MGTLNWRPDLAAHVKELDLREWGNCPRLEEYVGNFWEGYEERKEKEDKVEEEGKIGTLGQNGGFWEDDEADELDGEYFDELSLEDENENEGMGPEEEKNEDIEMSSDDDEEFEEVEDIFHDELACLGPSIPDREEKIDAMFLKSALDIGFGEFGTAFLDGFARYPYTSGLLHTFF